MFLYTVLMRMPLRSYHLSQQHDRAVVDAVVESAATVATRWTARAYKWNI